VIEATLSDIPLTVCGRAADPGQVSVTVADPAPIRAWVPGPAARLGPGHPGSSRGRGMLPERVTTLSQPL